MPASRNTHLPKNISIIINEAVRNGKMKHEAVINYLRTRNNISALLNNKKSHHFNIRPLHKGRAAKPTGQYTLVGFHTKSGIKAQQNLVNGEAAIIRAIRNFMLENPRQIIENLARIRTVSRANGPNSKFGHESVLNQVYTHMTGRSMAGNERELKRAKTAASKFNSAVATFRR